VQRLAGVLLQVDPPDPDPEADALASALASGDFGEVPLTGVSASEVEAERNWKQLSGGREIRDDRNEWEIETLLVRSVSDHVSVGFTFEGESSVSENQDARVDLSPSIEFNYFPYSIANRRQLTLQYGGGSGQEEYASGEHRHRCRQPPEGRNGHRHTRGLLFWDKRSGHRERGRHCLVRPPLSR
jgi:hypothetical protein